MRWCIVLGVAAGAVVSGEDAWAKKPKAAQAPSPEVQAAFGRYGEASKVFYEAYQAADVSAVQDLVWQLGDEGAPLQARLDALEAERDAAEQRLLAANEAVNAALATGDLTAADRVTADLRAAGATLAPLVEKLAALKAEVEAAVGSRSPTVRLADVAATSASELQRVFAVAGWAKEGAAIGTMLTSGYAYENFDVARDGKVLNVYVIRPDPTASGTGGRAPKAVAVDAEPDTAFRYHEATDCYVEIRPGDGATAADAKALLDQVVLP